MRISFYVSLTLIILSTINMAAGDLYYNRPPIQPRNIQFIPQQHISQISQVPDPIITHAVIKIDPEIYELVEAYFLSLEKPDEWNKVMGFLDLNKIVNDYLPGLATVLSYGRKTYWDTHAKTCIIHLKKVTPHSEFVRTCVNALSASSTALASKAYLIDYFPKSQPDSSTYTISQPLKKVNNVYKKIALMNQLKKLSKPKDIPPKVDMNWGKENKPSSFTETDF